jgi:hypothetical protein
MERGSIACPRLSYPRQDAYDTEQETDYLSGGLEWAQSMGAERTYMRQSRTD